MDRCLRPVGRRAKGLHAQRSGQSIVEFALAIPVFLALLFGTVDVGLLFKTRGSYQEAAQQAVRVVADTGGTDLEALNWLRMTLSVENMNSIVSVTFYQADVGGGYLHPDLPTTFTTYKYTPGASFSQVGPGWTSRSTQASSLDQIGVAITYHYTSITHAIPPLTMTQSASAQMEPTSY